MKSVHSETNRSFYDRISRSYDLLAASGEHHVRETGEKALAIQPGEYVLDIGFGTGSSLLAFAKLAGPQGKVTGVDISPRMLEVAREKLEAHGIADRVELKIGDARQLPLEDGTFDAVFLSFTLELFPGEDIPLVLAEVRRVLKPDGRAGFVSMATLPGGDSVNALERNYVWMHRHFPHIVDCHPIDVRGVLEDAHFTLVSGDAFDIWSMPVHVAVAMPAPVAAAAMA